MPWQVDRMAGHWWCWTYRQLVGICLEMFVFVFKSRVYTSLKKIAYSVCTTVIFFHCMSLIVMQVVYYLTFVHACNWSSREATWPKVVKIDTSTRPSNLSLASWDLDLCSLLPPLGHIWDVMLVWRKGSINKILIIKLSRCYTTVLCTIIRVHSGPSVLTGWSTGLGFNLAWFSSLSSKHLWCSYI